MDPDEALKKLREALQKWRSKKMEDLMTSPVADDREIPLRVAEQIADNAEALDGWLSRGGFLPEDWAKERK
jgi:hypothetical protein